MAELKAHRIDNPTEYQDTLMRLIESLENVRQTAGGLGPLQSQSLAWAKAEFQATFEIESAA